MKVLVLVMRGLHLGYVGCYGNGWIDTPALDRLAAEGVVFDQHIADCPDAAAARRAWGTGRYSFAFESDGEAPAVDLISRLLAQGVVTSLVVDDSHGFATTFDSDWSHVRQVPPNNQEPALERVLSAVGDALDDVSDSEHWLVWVELATLLPPWCVPQEQAEKYLNPPAPDDEAGDENLEADSLEPLPDAQPGVLGAPSDTTFLRLQGTYAGVVSYVDAGIGLLLEELKERALAGEVMVIVTTDHGQALGEHGIVGPYRPWLHDELIHLPLLVRLPGNAEAGRRIAALTQPVDLYPTLLEALGVSTPASHGHSLFPLIQGETQEPRAYAVSVSRLDAREEWALRTPDWAFLLPVAAPDEDPARMPQLYVKPDDRWEVNNVLQHHLESAELLERTLRASVAATHSLGPLQIPELEGLSR